MFNKNFIESIRPFMKRPGMFIGDDTSKDSLDKAFALVTGMDMIDDQDILGSFIKGLQSEKSCKSTPFGWPGMIRTYLAQHQVKTEDEVSAFIGLFAEFFESQNIHTQDPVKQKIKLKRSQSDPNAAYLTLPGHPGSSKAADRFDQKTEGCVSSTQKIRDVIPDYKGPDLNLDFDNEGTLIGIEILA